MFIFNQETDEYVRWDGWEIRQTKDVCYKQAAEVPVTTRVKQLIAAVDNGDLEQGKYYRMEVERLRNVG